MHLHVRPTNQYQTKRQGAVLLSSAGWRRARRQQDDRRHSHLEIVRECVGAVDWRRLQRENEFTSRRAPDPSRLSADAFWWQLAIELAVREWDRYLSLAKRSDVNQEPGTSFSCDKRRLIDELQVQTRHFEHIFRLMSFIYKS